MGAYEDNDRILALLERFLNFSPAAITADDVKTVAGKDGDESFAYAVLLASYCGVDVERQEEKRLFYKYFLPMVKKLERKEYSSDPYYKAVAEAENYVYGNWEFKNLSYEPYEAFVRDDFIADGLLIIPQIGFFTQKFEFPAVLQNGREWMTVTPNEIETMKQPIAEAFGETLTYGLGMGYYAYSAALKDEVKRVTVVEKESAAIKLFEKAVLPYLGKAADKIKIVEDDAFSFAKSAAASGYDCIFADIWHDVGDGIDSYRRLKECEKYSPTAKHFYWIEKSIKCYL